MQGILTGGDKAKLYETVFHLGVAETAGACDCTKMRITHWKNVVISPPKIQRLLYYKKIKWYLTGCFNIIKSRVSLITSIVVKNLTVLSIRAHDMIRDYTAYDNFILHDATSRMPVSNEKYEGQFEKQLLYLFHLSFFTYIKK